MPGPYPLATLAAKITPTGITAPSYQDILLSLIAIAQSIFGSDIYLGPDSQDYQDIAIRASAINDANQALIALYDGFSPAFSQGAMLSVLVKINGIAREGATNSTAELVIVGVAGTEIQFGLAQDENGILWQLPSAVVIPPSGTITVTATCVQTGAVVAPVNTINKINTVVLGWQSVNNPAAANVGTAIESDAALRQRQTISTSLPSQSPLDAILSAVANITGVGRTAIYENQTFVPDSNGVPGHSVALVVEGGDAQTIADTIELKKSPGTGTYGTTTEIVTDPKGVPIAINFFELTYTQIFVSIQVHALQGYVASTQQEIINAIVSFLNLLPIGSPVYLSWLYGIAQLTGTPLAETFEIASLQIGTSPTSLGPGPIQIPFNEASNTTAAQIQFSNV